MDKEGTCYCHCHWFGSLKFTFPGIIPLPDKLELFQDKPRRIKSFDIARTNVLGDIFEIFKTNDHDM